MCRTANGCSFSSVGLLRPSYRPEQEACAVRSLLRYRESLVQMAATRVNHMQKALDQMNLRLHHVMSDITGPTGLAIVDAILAGERDPVSLARLRHERIKASREVIAQSRWRLSGGASVYVAAVAGGLPQLSEADCRLRREIRRGLDEFKPPAAESPANKNVLQPVFRSFLHFQPEAFAGRDSSATRFEACPPCGARTPVRSLEFLHSAARPAMSPSTKGFQR
jgi:hypothetical protein